MNKLWYGKSSVGLVLVMFLIPFSWLFCGLVQLRRYLYKSGLFKSFKQDVPVIIVGNITAGGTGKTPLVIWLANRLRQEGYFPGIVSRGYRGKAKHWPQQVRPDSDPETVGDEAVLLAKRCHCPVAVAPDRVAAVRELLNYNDCDVIISDDGLQHYALARDIEIAVIDGVRRFGNGYCMPAGPLREPDSRLNEVDFIIVNGGGIKRREYSMTFMMLKLHQLKDESIICNIEDFRLKAVHAVAGISNPQKFFDYLERQGLNVTRHEFPDHHQFSARDFQFNDDLPVLMTEKDAVKCQRFSNDNYWYLAGNVQPDKIFSERLLAMIKKYVKLQ